MRDPIRDCPHGSMKGKCDSCELVEAGARIAELEAENARLRETAEKQRAILNNYSLAPDIHKLLRQLHEQILGVGDE